MRRGRRVRAGRRGRGAIVSARLYVITCESGCEWLVRASSAAAAMADWPPDAELAVSAEPLLGDRKRAAYLRDLGFADLDA